MRLQVAIQRGLCLVLALCFASVAEAGGLGRATTRGAARSLKQAAAKRAVHARTRNFYRREHLRDVRTPARPLTRPRTVYRYAPARRAHYEQRHGIAPYRHLASRPARGRPLGSKNARIVYGLPRKPTAVETVRLPVRQPVKFNRVVAGGRGRGEITSPRRLVPEAVWAVHPMH